MEEWFDENLEWNVGLVCGRIGGLVVLDVDVRHGGLDSAVHLGLDSKRATVVTGGGGYHYYYQYPSSDLRNSASAIGPGLDVRAEGGYVVASPSQFPGGNVYRRGGGWSDTALPEAPSWLLRDWKATPHAKAPTKSYQGRRGDPQGWGIDMAPAGEGTRNTRAASIAGSLVGLGLPQGHALSIMEVWNATNKPPLPDRELLSTLNSIYEIDKRNHV